MDSSDLPDGPVVEYEGKVNIINQQWQLSFFAVSSVKTNIAVDFLGCKFYTITPVWNKFTIDKHIKQTGVVKIKFYLSHNHNKVNIKFIEFKPIFIGRDYEGENETCEIGGDNFRHLWYT